MPAEDTRNRGRSRSRSRKPGHERLLAGKLSNSEKDRQIHHWRSRPPLLPQRVATLVSTMSEATRLSLEVTALFWEAVFETIAESTTSGLWLGSAAWEEAKSITLACAGILSPLSSLNPRIVSRIVSTSTAAGYSVVNQSLSAAENLLEGGFTLYTRAVNMGLHAAGEYVRFIDAIFGSTDTSRVLASFVHMCRREAVEKNPEIRALLSEHGLVGFVSQVVKTIVAWTCLQVVNHGRPRSYRLELVYTNQEFPRKPLLFNLARFISIASSAYGRSFMQVLGLDHGVIDARALIDERPVTEHPNHFCFSQHTGIPLSDLLFSSYVPPIRLVYRNPSIHALVHYIAVDHATRSVVLACRGTLGISDLFIDMICEYETIHLPGHPATKGESEYRVHSGMWDSALLLADQSSEVFKEVAEALRLYPEYGLVLTGHSLGGGVASLLTLLWSQPLNRQFATTEAFGLVSPRPIHCFSFGSPCSTNAALSHYCRGLVTSVANTDDFVSFLSVGACVDILNISAVLSRERGVAEKVVRKFLSRSKSKENLDDWHWSLIKTLRASMDSEKLYPPGDVFEPAKESLPVGLFYCPDVAERFSELRFTRSMIAHHLPSTYERKISALIHETLYN
ncbi:hypothetical protein GQ54DRAFT_258022 [Martensiomyces pterosporus]|nr:hypothetical protein GQ54DRAFT_258022 [Martensiomyces pterosporus]